MRRKTALATACLLALVAVCWLLTCSSPPAGPPFQVVAQTVAITNDPSGLRHTAIRVANSGRYAVMLLPIYGLQNQSGEWKTNLIPNGAPPLGTNYMGSPPFHPRAKRLEAGETCVLTIALPFDDSTWRATFWYLAIHRPLVDDARDLAAQVGLAKPNDIQRIVSTSWTH